MQSNRSSSLEKHYLRIINIFLFQDSRRSSSTGNKSSDSPAKRALNSTEQPPAERDIKLNLSRLYANFITFRMINLQIYHLLCAVETFEIAFSDLFLRLFRASIESSGKLRFLLFSLTFPSEYFRKIVAALHANETNSRKIAFEAFEKFMALNAATTADLPEC